MSLTSLIEFAVEQTTQSGNVMLETIWFPIVALTVFAALACVTLSYRHVANRHSHKADAYAASHAKELQQTGHGH
ncbi:hypothetical protein ABCS02_23805 [Microbacterium sp. X-17]|uniref:hypothetical protein n=1 Tax=Microbacterium sp. X-17 TaxID=3144404 RepID=UPI0031F4DBCC